MDLGLPCPFPGMFRIKRNLVESNHVLMLFRHALNDRTSSGSMISGNRGVRTHDLLVNSQTLCQLSYVPEYWNMLLSKNLYLLPIREECLFSLYADDHILVYWAGGKTKTKRPLIRFPFQAVSKNPFLFLA